MFRTQNLCPGSKSAFDSVGKTFFCFRAAKFVFATHVSRAAKLGTFASPTMFSSLARPLVVVALAVAIIDAKTP